MTNDRKNILRTAFYTYLMHTCSDNAVKVLTIMNRAEQDLPEFICKHLDADFESIYDIVDKDVTMSFQDKIALNPILKEEDQSQEEISYTDCLIYYRRFIKSKYHPDHKDYVAPLPVHGETPYTLDADNSPSQVADNNDVAPDPQKEIHEGGDKDIHFSGHERNPEARRECIAYFKSLHNDHIICECCGMDFTRAYGEIGKDYIEIHHRRPVSQRGGDYVVNPREDLVPLCSNCHSMIHRIGGQGDCMSLDELKERLNFSIIYND